MKVNLAELTSAMAKVKSFAQDVKNVPGVLLNFGEDNLRVCYSDGKKAITEKVGMEKVGDSGDFAGQIVVPYQSFLSILDSCQPSGMITTEDVDIAVLGNSLEMVAIKVVRTEADNEDGYTEKIVSRFRQGTPYADPSTDMRYGILSRMDYEGIFEGEEWDIWDRSKLREMLSRTSKEDGKTIYFSRNTQSAFVSNLAYLTYIPAEEIKEFGFTTTSKVAKYIVDILGKVAGDNIRLAVVDNRYCKVVSDDDKVGIWFEMAPASKTDPIVLKNYEEKQYTSYEILFNRYALLNAIDCATAVDKNEKTLLTFDGAPDGLYVHITNSKATAKNDFYVVAEQYKDNLNNLTEVSLPVSLKVMSDMLNNCTEGYVMMDICVEEKYK